MRDYQKRAVAEKLELDERLKKLSEFTSAPAFCVLPDDEQDRMMRQERAMRLYSQVLGERIAAFDLTPKLPQPSPKPKDVV